MSQSPSGLAPSPGAGRRSSAQPRSPGLVPSPVAHGMSVALAAVTIVATLPTVAIDGVLTGPAVMNGSARGTALGMLVLGMPLLLVGQLGTRRGVSAAQPVWLGALGYLLYNAVMLLFSTPFNRLFLAYVATLSLSLWTLVAVLRVVDVPAFGQRIRPGLPVRPIAVFTWVVAAMNVALWLRAIVAGLGAPASAPFLRGTGLTTAPTYVQDLAVWLPLAAVAACWLWRGLAWGYLVVTALLTMWVVESLTVAADQYLGSLADPASAVASASMTPAFSVLALVTAVPVVALLRYV